MATIAIGDVHGNLGALEDLLEKVLPILSAGDHLVFLGDYIDKGPDSRECVERIIRFRAKAPCPVVALTGNHEQWMMKTWTNPTSHSWIWNGGFETIRSYSAEAAARIQAELETAGQRLITEQVRVSYEAFFDQMPASHAAFFRELVPYYETSDVLCVHAGVDPCGSPIHLQDTEALVWGTDGFPERYRGQQTVVYGHWGNPAQDEAGWPRPRVYDNRTYGIDSICKGVLTAMRFPDGQVFQSRLIWWAGLDSEPQ